MTDDPANRSTRPPILTDKHYDAPSAFTPESLLHQARRQKQGTHAPPYMIAPYYFFFSHLYAAEAVELLPAEVRSRYRKRLWGLLLEVREVDGSWNDRVFERSKSFGTSMAVLAITTPGRSRPPGWPRSRFY